MFEFISNILTNIVNFFTSVWNFIINFFKEIVYIIELLASAVLNMPGYLVWLPSTITALLIAGIGIVVVYKIVGRD